MKQVSKPIISVALLLLVLLSGCGEPPSLEPAEVATTTVPGTMSAIQLERQPKPGEGLHVTMQRLVISFGDAMGWQGTNATAVPAHVKARSYAQAKALANDLLNKARSGADFDSLVKEYSDEKYPGIVSYANYGVTPGEGEYSRDTLRGQSAQLVRIAFGLKPGEVTLIDYDTQQQLTPGGFTILKRLK